MTEYPDIVLIEDEAAHALLVRRAFERQAGGGVLRTAGTLREARAMLEAQRPDLIISDWKLPDGEGIDLLREQTTATCPIVIMTSHGNEQLAVDVMKAGAFDYVVKSEEVLLNMPHLARRVLREWSHLMERRQAEQALHESEELNRQLIETMPGGIARISADETVVFANAEAQDLLGLHYDASRQAYVAGTEIQKVHEDGSSCRPEEEPVIRCLRTGQPQPPTVIGIGRPGRGFRWTIYNVAPCMNPQTLKPDGAMATLLDITEQQAAKEALEESKARNAAILQASQDGIITIDEESRIVDFNPAAEEIFGYQADAIIGESVTELVVPPRLREAHRAGMARYKATGVSNLLNRRIQSTAIRADGNEFPVEMVVQPIQMNRRRLFTAYLRDITERKAFEQALIEAKENAEETSLLKSSFLNSISHEIRTPLTAIIGFSTILQDEVGPEQREMVELVEQSGKRLLSTFNTVLDLCMLEAGTLKLEQEWVNLEELVQEKIGIFGPVAQVKRIEIVLENMLGDAEMYVDRACMGRVLVHLLDNAIKFTEDGAVRIGIASEADRLVLFVADTGVGMEDAFQHRLYEEFRQESMGTTRSYEGTGLGLSITKRMVDLLGGTILVQSKKGIGSTFALQFPRSLLRLPGSLVAPAADDHGAKQQKPRILAVEDSMEIEILLTYVLQESYLVDVVKNEQEALEKVGAGDVPYDLVLMDINLGEQRTGIDVMRDLRTLRSYANVPIVAMTAYALFEDRERFLDLGFDGYISKPFANQELLETIGQMLKPAPRRHMPVFPLEDLQTAP